MASREQQQQQGWHFTCNNSDTGRRVPLESIHYRAEAVNDSGALITSPLTLIYWTLCQLWRHKHEWIYCWSKGFCAKPRNAFIDVQIGSKEHDEVGKTKSILNLSWLEPELHCSVDCHTIRSIGNSISPLHGLLLYQKVHVMHSLTTQCNNSLPPY